MANKFKVPITCSVDTSQLKALIDRLTDLDKRAGRAGVRKGLNELTKKVMWAARGLVPRRTGLLKKSLGRKVIVTRGGKRLTGIVKPRRGDKFATVVDGKKIDPRKYAHLVEFGRVSVTVKKKKVLADGKVIFGKRVKAVSPQPFMRPAWSENEASAVPILHRWLTEALASAWARSRARVPKAKRKP